MTRMAWPLVAKHRIAPIALELLGAASIGRTQMMQLAVRRKKTPDASGRGISIMAVAPHETQRRTATRPDRTGRNQKARPARVHEFDQFQCLI